MLTKNEIVLDMELPPIPTPVVKAIRTGNTLTLARKIDVVENPEQEKAADALRKDLRDIFQLIEKRRLEVSNERFKNPQHAFKMAVDEKLAPFKDEESRLWGLIQRYRAKVEAERQRAQQAADEAARKLDEKRQKIRDAHEAKGHKTTELVPTEVEEVKDQLATSTVKTRKLWTYDHDTIDMSKLPDEFKMVDYGKLTRAIQGDGGKHDIPGVNIYQTETR